MDLDHLLRVRPWRLLLCLLAASAACSASSGDGDDNAVDDAEGGHAGTTSVDDVGARGGAGREQAQGGGTSMTGGIGGVADAGAGGSSGGHAGASGNGGKGGSGGTAGMAGNAGGGTGGNAPAGQVPTVVAVGTGGLRVASSDGGQHWERRAETRQNGGDDEDLLRAVAYGNGVWVAAGVFRLYTSTDTRMWTQRTLPLCMEAVAFGQGKFIAMCGGATMTSVNGVTWTRGASIRYRNQGRSVSRSPNGQTWSSVYTDDHGNSLFSDNAYHAIAFGFAPP